MRGKFAGASLKVLERLPELKPAAAAAKEVAKSDQLFVKILESKPHVARGLAKLLAITGVTVAGTTGLVAYLSARQIEMTGCFRYEFAPDGSLRSVCKVAQCSCAPETATRVTDGAYMCRPHELVGVQLGSPCADTKADCIQCDMVSLAGHNVPSNVIYQCQAPTKLDVAGTILNSMATETGSLVSKLGAIGFNFFQIMLKIIPYLVGGGCVVLIIFASVKLWSAQTPKVY